jgi:hypothetical protein
MNSTKKLLRHRRWAERIRKGCGMGVLLAGFVLLTVNNAAMAGGGGGGGGGGAPEIDPGSAFSAFTLLTGGLLLLADRFRAKKPRA